MQNSSKSKVRREIIIMLWTQYPSHLQLVYLIVAQTPHQYRPSTPRRRCILGPALCFCDLHCRHLLPPCVWKARTPPIPHWAARCYHERHYQSQPLYVRATWNPQTTVAINSNLLVQSATLKKPSLQAWPPAFFITQTQHQSLAFRTQRIATTKKLRTKRFRSRHSKTIKLIVHAAAQKPVSRNASKKAHWPTIFSLYLTTKPCPSFCFHSEQLERKQLYSSKQNLLSAMCHDGELFFLVDTSKIPIYTKPRYHCCVWFGVLAFSLHITRNLPTPGTELILIKMK